MTNKHPKEMKNFLLGTIAIFLSFLAVAQDSTTTQNIRGRAIDKVSQYPIIGAKVEVLGVEPKKAGLTDLDGYFVIIDVPIGRQSVKLSAIGYNEVVKQNLLLQTGKELVINFEVEEKVVVTKTVSISAKKDKSETNNQNVSVSARTFDTEETQRFAGSLNDPARMAQNFAGVANSDDSRNDIVIRGNSPLGVQFRMEGIVIPNPNHFGALGTTGGPVSILNNNLLANSDFMTGAFPSEYGNVLAGVFDLKMRNGNHDKYEFLGQIGFNGFEFGAEGPISRDNKSSFLANYRYSTLEVFELLGLSFGTTALPQYQDFSFKLNVPTKKAGKFVMFGMGGLSYIELLGSELEDDDLFGENDEDTKFGSDMGVVGMSHLYFHDDKTFSRSGFSISGTRNDVSVEQLFFNGDGSEVINKRLDYGNKFTQLKYNLMYSYNKKYSTRDNIQLGVMVDAYGTNFQDSTYYTDGGYYLTLRNVDGTTMLPQAFAHWQHKFNERLVLNAGTHFQLLTLNNSTAIEPRLGLKYKLTERHELSIGTGLHSMIQPFQVYYQEAELSQGEYARTNEDLDFTRAAHLVAGHNWIINENVRLKSEAYYQAIYNAPVENFSSSFSMLNAGADFGIPSVDSLVNDGIGRNYGLEFTLERFFKDGYYFLFTNSLFNSEYQGSDKVWRSTAFNNRYVVNGLIGKEFAFNQKNALAIDIKGTWAGGKRYTPIDVETSIADGETVFFDDLAFSEKFDDYLRLDVKFTYRRNGKRATQEWAVDIRNATNRQNIFTQSFDPVTGQVNETYQIAILPITNYRILF